MNKNRPRQTHRPRYPLARLGLVVTVVLVAVGCSSMAYTPARPGSAGSVLATASDADSRQPVIDASQEADPGITDAEVYEGSGVFIDERAAQPRARPVAGDGEIVLNFEGESIQSVVHTVLGEVLQETFVIAPGVGGEVTFSTSKPVTREQLMPILELLLRWNGAALVWSEGRYHVLPMNDAVRGHLVPEIGNARARGYAVRAVPLKYIAPSEMAKILAPYARDGAILNADTFRNMIFLAGTPEELSNYLRTVEIFDVDWLEGMSVGIVPLQTVEVDSNITELEGIFGTQAESPLAGMVRFVPLERLGSIMVITYQEEYLYKAEEWIEILDRGAAGAGKQLFVYRVKNLEAQVLAGYLTQLFGGASAQTTSRRSQGTLAPGLEPATVGSVQQFNESRLGSQQGGRDAGGAGGSSIAMGDSEVRITSILETNSLLIQATQSEYNAVLAAIERIDIEPLQVLIESQVLDVELNEELQFGVNWFLTNNPNLIPDGVGDISRYVQSASFGSGSSESGGFNFLTTLATPLSDGMPFVQATIAALDAVTDVRSLAAPSLLVRNNATATITVGTQVPVQSSSISTGTNNVVSSAQYVSTGVTLTVTPRINPGGLVYLDIQQDVSRPGARDPDISTSGNPPINNKTVTSQVAVQSGQTVFLGGLISEQDSRGRSGVPFLSRVPFVGPLFGSRTKTKTRSETVVMITPTVIESSVDLEAVSDQMQEQFSRVPPLTIWRLNKVDREADPEAAVE